jgi:DNA topoisomerase I
MAKKASIAHPNLVIVESPAKAKTIEKFLGPDYLVKSSYGHIRDLVKNDFGVDVQKNFEPQYVVPADKKDLVKELKGLADTSDTVWLASDEDREGEAIAWHLYEVLGLTEQRTKRIVFHEITKDAILKAVKNPRTINKSLVDAQQARRILDRLVGFELSPVLWRKVKPSLSAGRVQSVAVRLIVEKEREIFGFEAKDAYRVTAVFIAKDENGKEQSFTAELNHRFETLEETRLFLEFCKNAAFSVDSVEKKPFSKSPAAPFTTSTLQQEASRKLGFSVAQTMSVAQKLYEAGQITYMRTDSVNLSDEAIAAAARQIEVQMGEKYLNSRQYKTKSKGAQEAHEAIRPSYMQNDTVPGTPSEKRLYELIWKRTIASQMSDAQLEKTTITVTIGGNPYRFAAVGEVIRFDGFLKVYIESSDVEKDQEDEQSALLPAVQKGQSLKLRQSEARQRWTQKPSRYSEASLVRKLEELGIGRPSTYAPTISTVQQRGYVVKEDRSGVERQYNHLLLKDNKLEHSVKTENTGAERSKLFPTDIGMVVNDFLVKYFQNVLSFDFTANVEKEFDEIAMGNMKWENVIDGFYKPFHAQVVETIEKSEKSTGERVLGQDPESGKTVLVKIGRFGPMVQMGDTSDESEKPRFAGLRTGQHLETISLDEALELFKMPREVGDFEGKKVVVGIGRFGPYVRHDGKFVSLKKEDDPYQIDLATSIMRIENKRDEDNKKVIKTFAEETELSVLNGRWGPYIVYRGMNYKIPKNTDAEKLSYEECLIVLEGQKGTPNKAAKAAAAKKAKSSPKSKAKPTAKGEKTVKAKAKPKTVKKK